MRTRFVFSFLLVSSFAAIAQPAPSPTPGGPGNILPMPTPIAVPVLSMPSCPRSNYESGIITNSGGPNRNNPNQGIVITTIVPGQDPAAPRSETYLIWTNNNTWFAVSQMRGPFYLKPGEDIVSRNDFSPAGAIYSGYRC